MGLFVLSGLEDSLPAMFRLATLQEVHAHREEQLKAMPKWEMAHLADGWVNGASYGGGSGSDRRTDIGHNLIVRTAICVSPSTCSFALYGLQDNLPATFRLATLHDVSAHREDQLKVMPGWEIANLADGWVDGAVYGGRSGPGCRSDVGQKLACNSTICDFPNRSLFVLCRWNDWCAPSCRLATLHEVQTNREQQLKAMPKWEIASLADGWVDGASYGGRSGPGSRNDAGYKLCIDIACCEEGDDEKMAITLEPNPSEELIRYIEENVSEDGRRVKRSPGREKGFSEANTAMEVAIRELIDLWVNIDVGSKQGTVLTHKGFRIDQQRNGGYDKIVTNNGLTYKQHYQNLAVQRGSDVFANVHVPVGMRLGKQLIQKALYESLELGKTKCLLPAPKNLHPRFKYILTTLAVGTVGLFALLLG